MNRRYLLSQFYHCKATEIQYSSFQEPTDDIYDVENLAIVSLAMDFPAGTSVKARKAIEQKWIGILPQLHKVKAISVRHRAKDDFFEAVCQMPNLERAFFWSSTVEDIKGIVKLTKLKSLKLRSFSRLISISPLLSLKNLTILSIDNCFKVENYEIIGQMTGLIGLELCGDVFAPKKLPIGSLRPFTQLKNLKHLDISSTSIIDKSYECILEMENLERLDFHAKMQKATREFIKTHHKSLKAGFFVDYDFEINTFYEGKQWDKE